MDFICNNCDAIYAVLISGILGAIGQALRIGMGLYKLKLEKYPLSTVSDQSNPSKRLGVIFIGFLLGIMITIITNTEWNSFTVLRVIALIASGYVATLMIENTKSFFIIRQIFAQKPSQ